MLIDCNQQHLDRNAVTTRLKDKANQEEKRLTASKLQDESHVGRGIESKRIDQERIQRLWRRVVWVAGLEVRLWVIDRRFRRETKTLGERPKIQSGRLWMRNKQEAWGSTIIVGTQSTTLHNQPLQGRRKQFMNNQRLTIASDCRWINWGLTLIYGDVRTIEKAEPRINLVWHWNEWKGGWLRECVRDG